MSTLVINEGLLDFSIASISKTCQTYYKVFGTLSSLSRPLITLHGGPGVGSEYMEPFADLITPSHAERVVIVYDQLGTGRSTHLPEKMGDTAFWTVQLFIEELENLISGLGIEQYDLIGHSWGGMLAASYAIQQPKGLNKLILSSSPASMELWVEAQNVWKTELPVKTREVLEKYEEDGVETPEYHAAVACFYSLHMCLLDPMPQGIVNGFKNIESDPTVYLTMNGPSEFNVTGSLRTWSVVDEVHKIDVPTLVTNGAKDEARDSVVEPFVAGIHNVKWVRFEKSSHMAHYEEREEFMHTVATFLYN